MADNFQGTKTINLQPSDSAVPYTFTYSVCSSATANDGSLPFGTLISTADVKAFDENGADVTTEIVHNDSNTTTVVSVALKYPATSKEGRYSLEIVLTLDNGAVMETDFVRVFAKDVAA